ncbi:hypothetical protein AWB80_07760 [Caballeronia pedi]|uniref:Uncharacterized protein n=1 Tax=Caballeronia pedi TaxID=1777141 RepID=A0A158E1Z7_9BURK|nr:hypothetical protein AWB80_07760 [Caballeronia pedi]
MTRAAFGIQCGEADAPGIAQRREMSVAATVARVLDELRIEQCRQWRGFAYVVLRHDPRAKCTDRDLFDGIEETGLSRRRETFVDDLTCDVVP